MRATALLLVLLAAACAPDTVADQTAALTVTPAAAASRGTQTRRFDTTNAALLLSSSAQLLQDLGFSIDEAKASAGLIVASKTRDAIEADQVAGQAVLVLLAAAAGVAVNPVYERMQRIRVLVSIAPAQERTAYLVRATFQRIIWDNHGQVSRTLTIDDPKLYQEFFDKLAQSSFLTANSL